ncbi:MAG: YbjN domain-containing protein [Lentisphaeria bacterium]|nr:YbjN domain-containing protein [Lentisphaeria bacterium]
MKRIIPVVVLFVCTFCTFSSFAAAAKPEAVTIPLLREWVSEKYGSRIDKDGDLVINADGGKIFVTVYPKIKLLRICTRFAPFKKRTKQEMIDLANKFNDSRRLLRVSIRPNGGAFCDFHMVYNGGLDSVNFLEAVDWFLSLKSSWVEFVINGGDKPKK